MDRHISVENFQGFNISFLFYSSVWLLSNWSFGDQKYCNILASPLSISFPDLESPLLQALVDLAVNNFRPILLYPGWWNKFSSCLNSSDFGWCGFLHSNLLFLLFLSSFMPELSNCSVFSLRGAWSYLWKIKSCLAFELRLLQVLNFWGCKYSQVNSDFRKCY